jgi:predicted RNA-binding protein with PUA-like domain
MEITLSIILIIAFLIVCWFVLKNQQYKNFRKNMKPGTRCYFYIGENREPGQIETIDQFGNIIIRDQYGNFHVRNPKDLYI